MKNSLKRGDIQMSFGWNESAKRNDSITYPDPVPAVTQVVTLNRAHNTYALSPDGARVEMTYANWLKFFSTLSASY
jgi:hypothetical protein